MHYRNGREAKNGDKVVQLGGNGTIVGLGVLYDAQPGNDYCNGGVAPIATQTSGACLIDCLHVDDVATIIYGQGLGERPAGK